MIRHFLLLFLANNIIGLPLPFHKHTALLNTYTSLNIATSPNFASFKPLSLTSSTQNMLEKYSDIPAIHENDFPILKVEAYPGKPLIYLDSAATSQKPLCVIEAMDKYYKTYNSNVHRGIHALAARATKEFENARDVIHKFINSRKQEEIIFTKGATEAINLVALSYGTKLRAGDEIILSIMEHHSNIVPWQLLAQRTGAVLKYIHLKDGSMTLDIDQYKSLLSTKTKIVAISHASNVLGCINPVEEMIKEAHRYNAVVLLDACQSVPHMPIDVQALDVDFIVASSHKLCGPTGIGFLYGKMELLDEMPPVIGGGEMIDVVKLESSTYAPLPYKFEAGTPAIAEAVGFSAACEYLMSIGMKKVFEHDTKLGTYLYNSLEKIPDLTLYGPKPSDINVRTGLVAFNHARIHCTDLAFFLDREGVAVRTGHHCAQPLHESLGVAGSMRASLYLYNSKSDVDTFIEKLKATIHMFENLNKSRL